MSTRHLERFFAPSSIAVLGASEREDSFGGFVLANLRSGGFPGKLIAVHPSGGEQVHGAPRYSSVAEMLGPPDLAVVCNPPEEIPGDVEALGKAGVKAALVLMGGLSQPRRAGGFLQWAGSLLGGGLETLREATAKAARPYDIRIMGPNCLGILSPARKLNASYAHLMPEPGQVAFVGQSATLGLALVDWAHGRGVGFSHLLTLGDSLDVDVTDVIEHLADDRATRVLLLHIERFPAGRRFLSAVRAASRGKVVIAMKSARAPALQDPAVPVPRGLVDVDAVHDAVLRRAGVLRVDRTDEMADALSSLSRFGSLAGERLAIVANGAGPGTLAADALLRSGGVLARLDEATVARLGAQLPAGWNGRNPVDISANATPGRYVRTLEALREDRGVDAILVILVPTAIATPLKVADVVIAARTLSRQPVLASWMGERTVAEARDALARAGVPTFDTPEQAVESFMQIVRYQRAQAVLQQTPPPFSAEARPDVGAVWALVGEARRAGRDYLTEEECARLLRAYGVPMAPTRFARRAAELEAAAAGIAPPYALKIVHAEQCRPFAYDPPSRWRGIERDVRSAAGLAQAAARLAEEVGRRHPGSTVHGFALQPMHREAESLLLALGITRDATFGPLILFGAGGSPRRMLADRGIGLPPLNLALARMLVESTAVGRQIGEYAAEPERAVEALCEVLVSLSRLVVDVPVIRGLEINPVLADREGLLALSAQIDLGEPAQAAIRPYPEALRETVTLERSGRRAELRPIRGEDEPMHLEFASRLSPESVRNRFLHAKTRITHRELAQLTQIDYAREMAFVAVGESPEGRPEILGVVRSWTDPDNVAAEFALIVRDDLRGQGLGKRLLGKMIAYARARGTLQLRGTTLPDNAPMRGLADRMGFASRFAAADDLMVVELALNPPVEDWQRERLAAR